MKTLIAFIAGLAIGAGVGALAVLAGLFKGEPTNGNGYEYERAANQLRRKQ